jgi:hypothetical protein
MEKIVVESVQEFRDHRDINENREINEGVFNSLKGNVDTFLKDPKDEKTCNQLITDAFASQFAKKEKTKTFILGLDFDKKIEILKMAQARLQDPKVGVLKLMKNDQGKLIVGGMAVQGGPTSRAGS